MMRKYISSDDLPHAGKCYEFLEQRVKTVKSIPTELQCARCQSWREREQNYNRNYRRTESANGGEFADENLSHSVVFGK